MNISTYTIPLHRL